MKSGPYSCSIRYASGHSCAYLSESEGIVDQWSSSLWTAFDIAGAHTSHGRPQDSSTALTVMKDKIKLLLERGYFPVQLPPGFVTGQFAKVHKPLGKAWEAHKPPRMLPERFSVARSSYHRRVTSILNPVGYYHLCHALEKHWSDIQRHFSRSRSSFSRPKLEKGLRAIRLNRFSDVHDHRLVQAAGYRYALVTDISRFFPTIYTHTIPWALHGKSDAKRNKSYTPTYWGNLLDSRSQLLQDFQTLGLPIGPDSSHVIAEIIATAIDQKIRQGLGAWPNGFRYVDDFYLFFNERAEAERALAVVTRAVSGFVLEINASKTRIVETKELIEESWKYKIKGAEFADSPNAQRNDIHRFFEDLISLEKSYLDESVVKYGLKIASSRIIKRQNWQVFESYLLHCGLAYPNSLQTVASLLATYAAYGYSLDTKAIRRFCNAIIVSHAQADHHSEVAWALWILVELNMTLDAKAADALAHISSSACLLLGLFLQKRLKGTGRIPSTKLSVYSTKDALFEDGWLLAYEGGRRLWLNAKSTSHISADPFFSKLLKLNVSFFDGHGRLPKIFTPKGDVPPDVFEAEGSVDKYFDFEETDEEYFDTAGNAEAETEASADDFDDLDEFLA